MTYQIYTEHIGYCKHIIRETEDIHEAHMSAVAESGGIMVKHESDGSSKYPYPYVSVLEYNDPVEELV